MYDFVCICMRLCVGGEEEALESAMVRPGRVEAVLPQGRRQQTEDADLRCEALHSQGGWDGRLNG